MAVSFLLPVAHGDQIPLEISGVDISVIPVVDGSECLLKREIMCTDKKIRNGLPFCVERDFFINKSTKCGLNDLFKITLLIV